MKYNNILKPVSVGLFEVNTHFFLLELNVHVSSYHFRSVSIFFISFLLSPKTVPLWRSKYLWAVSEATPQREEVQMNNGDQKLEKCMSGDIIPPLLIQHQVFPLPPPPPPSSTPFPRIQSHQCLQKLWSKRWGSPWD